jgi:hypothetical protein
MHYKTKKGLSLVELAISISIIALLIVGTLGGSNMLKAAKIRRVVTEFTTIKRAIDEFQAEYNYLPGDMADAYSFWGDDCGSNSSGSAGSCNGDGDGAIEFTGVSSGTPTAETTAGTPQEDLLAWEHLAFSLLYPGNYTGQNVSSTVRYQLGTNVPRSESYAGTAYMLRTEANSNGYNIYNTRGTTFRLGGIADVSNDAKQYPVGGAVSARNAYSIDVKIDDGKASSGLLYSIRTPKLSPPGSGCTDNVWTATSASYDLDDSSKTCTLVFWYQKL